jgi:hypothetical protein
MWNLEILNKFGGWTSVQWLSGGNAQMLTSETLPKIQEDEDEVNKVVW